MVQTNCPGRKEKLYSKIDLFFSEILKLPSNFSISTFSSHSFKSTKKLKYDDILKYYRSLSSSVIVRFLRAPHSGSSRLFIRMSPYIIRLESRQLILLKTGPYIFYWKFTFLSVGSTRGKSIEGSWRCTLVETGAFKNDCWTWKRKGNELKGDFELLWLKVERCFRECGIFKLNCLYYC